MSDPNAESNYPSYAELKSGDFDRSEVDQLYYQMRDRFWNVEDVLNDEEMDFLLNYIKVFKVEAGEAISSGSLSLS